MGGSGRSAVHFLPIVTSVAAIAFALALARRFRLRGGTHLAWWCLGMVLYGVGTITESATTLLGWREALFRAWYISGALLGGAPLAQGTAYLMLPRRTAHRLTGLLLVVVAVGAVAVLLSPIRYESVEPYRLSGRVLEWTWVRAVSPFINLYAVTLLAGGAAVSAVRFRRRTETRHRYLGNVAIAVGAVLPGIGGTFTRLGHVEVLYVTELLGLALIWAGYRLNTEGRVFGRPALPTPGGPGEGSVQQEHMKLAGSMNPYYQPTLDVPGAARPRDQQGGAGLAAGESLGDAAEAIAQRTDHRPALHHGHVDRG